MAKSMFKKSSNKKKFYGSVASDVETGNEAVTEAPIQTEEKDTWVKKPDEEMESAMTDSKRSDNTSETEDTFLVQSQSSSEDKLQYKYNMPKIRASFCEEVTSFDPGSIPQSVVVGTTVGIICGAVASLYYYSLFFLLDYLWKDLPEKIIQYAEESGHAIPESSYFLWTILICSVMAILVGVAVIYLGEPGDLPYTVKCVHEKAYIGMDHVMPMVVASQFSILGGGSLGPEAPLVAICAAFGGYISRSIFHQTDKNIIRKHTLMGMASALAAFCGCPLGGSLFALEVNHRFGMEYFEHALEAIFSGTVCLVVMRALIEIPVGPIWTISDVRLPADEPSTVLVGFALGLLGAFVAFLFVKFHTAVMGYLQGAGLLDNKKAIYRALFGLCGILPLGLLVPHTLFWGEEEIQVIANGRPASELTHMFPTWGISGFEMDTPLNAFIVGATKMIAISFTVAGGYRGGFIFPFFAAGSAFGRCLYMLLPKITCLTPQVASLCFAAGINVAITRTALATTVILSALSGEINANSPILAASMASIFATAYMPFMSTQIARKDLMYEFSVSDRSDDHEDDEKH